MKIYFDSPVNSGTEEEHKQAAEYVKELESAGYEVYYPKRDTNQDQSILDICLQNKKAIEECDQVHVWYLPDSKGINFDLGMAFALKKKIYWINYNVDYFWDRNPSDKTLKELMIQYSLDYDKRIK